MDFINLFPMLVVCLFVLLDSICSMIMDYNQVFLNTATRFGNSPTIIN